MTNDDAERAKEHLDKLLERICDEILHTGAKVPGIEWTAHDIRYLRSMRIKPD